MNEPLEGTLCKRQYELVYDGDVFLIVILVANFLSLRWEGQLLCSTLLLYFRRQ